MNGGANFHSAIEIVNFISLIDTLIKIELLTIFLASKK